jgi:hypothetical protein
VGNPRALSGTCAWTGVAALQPFVVAPVDVRRHSAAAAALPPPPPPPLFAVLRPPGESALRRTTRGSADLVQATNTE